ncbi:MAG: hypothetical protein WC023_06390 [Rhodocyclaceae bacterium]
MQLIRYEAARAALDAAVMFDEVTAIIDAAERASVYAKQANDNDLIEKATEIRVRAQRKAGEMLTKAAEQGMRATKESHGRGGQVAACDQTPPTLADIGLTKSQSSRYQQLAAMPDEHFETAVATAKATAGEVTTAFMLREAKNVAKRPRAERVAEIRALVNGGHNVEQIAEAQGVGVRTVQEILNAADIKVPIQRRGRPIDSDKIVRESVAALSGIAQGLNLARGLSIDANEASELLADLRASMKALRTLDSNLKEIANGK